MYRLDAFHKLYPQCMHCGQDFVIEPGFYMGASYLGYGFTALISLAGALASVFLFPDVNAWVVIGVIVAAILVSLPLIFRYACTVTLHVLGGVKFDPSLARRKGMYVGEDGLLHEGEPPGA